MDINASTTVTKISYRIEPNPNGGFIARPSDPSMEVIEGATTEVLQQKIQAKLTEIIDQQLPTSLKLGGLNIRLGGDVKLVTHRNSAAAAQESVNTLAEPNTVVGDLAGTQSDKFGNVLRAIAAGLAFLALLYFLLLRR